MLAADDMVPNVPGLAKLAGAVAAGGFKFTMLKVFVPSIRNCRAYFWKNLKSRNTAKSTVLNPGWSNKLRAEFPSTGLPVTTGFRVNAAMLNQQLGVPTLAPLGQVPECGSPTRFARSPPAPSRFASTPSKTVNGTPLWYLTIGEIDHPFRMALATPLPPYENSGCHTAEKETACRWSMSARPFSSPSASMF